MQASGIAEGIPTTKESGEETEKTPQLYVMEPKAGIENNVEYLKSIGLHEAISALPIRNDAYGLKTSWR